MVSSLPGKYRLRTARWSILLPALATALALAIYWITLQPGLLGGDSAEAQFAPYTLSIMHVTGYPFYTLLGYLWSHLVLVGDVAYRMNLLSAVAGAIAVGELMWLGQALGRSWIAGGAAAALMAFSTQFWDWSTKAGVRSLNVAFMLAVFSVAVWWARDQKTGSQIGNRKWVLLWFIVGLSLAHHRTTILILPGLCIYLLWSRPGVLRDWRAYIAAIAAALPGVLTYLYLPLRSAGVPPYQYMPVDTVDHFLDLVLARNLSDMVTSITWQQVPERLSWFIEYLISQFGMPAVVISLAGMVSLLIRRPKEGVMLSLSLVFLMTFTIDYRIEGMAQLNVVFLLPVHAIVSVCIGVLLGAFIRLVLRTESIVPTILKPIGRMLLYGLAIVGFVLIALPISSRKIRGGIGIHLALGFLIAFSYLLTQQFSTVFSLKANLNALLSVWIPNVFFAALGIILLFLIENQNWKIAFF